ncbi:bifunctional DNA-formamidopyrimidine glycosylase/DNA-(apurinic or apyrimidinic site) lyase [Nakamurella sp. YIM 132087]|uniref:Formamidopyrimidine-DNA glycosylase n=1 Tax=Nakamurella alba TaxID=2665158 RepID=A0A7K1FJU3_9ACTN|nr:bifunctional DNA-formamidopyrimidine glycosylase/DNA-(apurinic or apyrimidinic site) lyase [Nakamurella alba]MTD13523.1 bifunctional DNA-formamidopyrimidine glycosylase/DNA-(apurinic or apyrimidinic site) lyase [Nakamurella alba]
MPELPEVEVVRRGLTAHAAGRRISGVQVFHDRAVRRHIEGPADFQAVLTGHRIDELRRRGKYLWFALDDGDAVLAHLGMSGQFRVGTPGGAVHPHLRVRFTFDDGGPDLDFLDQRTFGGMQFVPGGAELPDPIAHIALDPLDPDFDRDLTIARLRAKRTEVKRALLDQTVVSGVGNIYADESLWRVKLHYARPTGGLTKAVAGGLLNAATEVMQDALAAGGTSFDSLYVNVNGESGYFDRSLHAYGRENEPCDRCGTPIRRDPFMNRSSFFCPVCQRPPRGR